MNIKQSPSGQVVKAPQGYGAFVPNPLPPEIQWNADLANALSRADYLLGKLAREGSQLPNPHLLTRSFVTREAVLSSKIEGTQATIAEVLAKNAGIEVQHDADDMQEVQNYIVALNYGLSRLTDLPLSLRLIKDIHAQLMQGARGGHATPGEFRKSQNWIGLPGSTIQSAKYVPPPVDRMKQCLQDLEQFLHNRQLPPLIHIALCHYQFEAIHPFLDGNGRMGRLLISMLMILHEVLPSPLLYLSAFFEATRDVYYQQLYQVSTIGNWHDWLLYFLNGVAVQSDDTLSRVERINMLLMQWQQLFAHSTSGVPQRIIKQIAANPYITIKGVAKLLDIAYSTAQRGIKELESRGIIQQANNKARDRIYCATEILSILEEPAKIAYE